MNLKTVLLISTLALSLTACRQPSAHPDAEAHEPSSSAGQAAALQLDQGRKWAVPPPMMAYIRNLEKAVRDLESAPTKDHAALAAAIREQLAGLVTHCTLEGKAHDELHKWLMPFLALSEDYFKATDPRAQEKQFREVQRSLVVFDHYFE